MTPRNMRLTRLVFRVFYCWYFALLSMIFCAVTLWNALPRTQVPDAGLRRPVSALATGSICAVLGTIFGVAAWAAFQERASPVMRRRGWLIAASLLSLLGSIGIPVLYWCAQGVGTLWYSERVFGLPTIVGVAGLIAFTRPNRQPEVDTG